MMRFDDVDEQIIAILTADARTSNREVAREIGISETAVRKRLKRLSESGAAKVSTVIDPSMLGLHTSALIRLQTSPAAARAVVENAASLECVSFAALTSGRFNVVVLLTVPDRSALTTIIHEQFRCWHGIHSIDTIELVANAKHRLDLILISADR